MVSTIEAPEKYGLRETTLVVKTVDYGENLGERSVSGHG